MKLIPENHTIANSVELLDGSSSNTVADLQVLNDGNNYHIDEAAATPGQRFNITFINVIRFTGLAIKSYYSGSASHYVEVQLYNCITGNWDTQITIENSNGMNYRLMDVDDTTLYIANNGDVKMRFFHPLSGSGAHDTFIEYVALVR